MQLLTKNIEDKDNPRNDNTDKKPLFPEGESLTRAEDWREDWRFVNDDGVARNISYQLQYIDFLVRLYNEYRIYLTLEALLCKNILIAINSIVESALYVVIGEAVERNGDSERGRSDFTALLGQAYHSFRLIDKDLWHFFHELRKERNNLHLYTIEDREYARYTPTQVNEALQKLEAFRSGLLSRQTTCPRCASDNVVALGYGLEKSRTESEGLPYENRGCEVVSYIDGNGHELMPGNRSCKACSYEWTAPEVKEDEEERDKKIVMRREMEEIRNMLK